MFRQITSQAYLGDIQDYDGNKSITLTMGGEFNDGRGHLSIALQRDTQEEINYGQLDRYRDCNEDVIRTRTYADGKAYQQQYFNSSMTLPYGDRPQGEIGMCSVLRILPFEGSPMDWYGAFPRGQYLFTPEVKSFLTMLELLQVVHSSIEAVIKWHQIMVKQFKLLLKERI